MKIFVGHGFADRDEVLVNTIISFLSKKGIFCETDSTFVPCGTPIFKIGVPYGTKFEPFFSQKRLKVYSENLTLRLKLKNNFSELEKADMRHDRSQSNGRPGDSPVAIEGWPTFDPPHLINSQPEARGREQARRSICGAIARGSDSSNATEERAVLTVGRAGGQFESATNLSIPAARSKEVFHGHFTGITGMRKKADNKDPDNGNRRYRHGAVRILPQ